MATGTGKRPLELTYKPESVHSTNQPQDRVKQAQNLAIVGGGAFGIRACFSQKYESIFYRCIPFRDGL